MAKFKEDKIVIVKASHQIDLPNNICPVSNVTFIGVCPNVGCPANIAQRRTNQSGCYFEKGKGDLIDVARWTKLTTHEVKRRYSKGIRKLERFTAFYNFLQSFRENGEKKYCPKCGITSLHNHNLECANGNRCEKRQKLYRIYLQRFPFNIKLLNVSANEFWAACLKENLVNVLPKKLINRVKKLTENIR